MFRGLITPYSYTTGAPVAITQGFNTNAKYALENDKILIKSVGLTDIDATIVVEGTSGAVLTCTMKVNDQVYATVSFTVAEGSTYTFPFSEVVATQLQTMMNSFQYILNLMAIALLQVVLFQQSIVNSV